MTRLQQRIRRRKLKRLAVKVAQKVCVATGFGGIILCILAGAIAENPVSTFALEVIYIVLGILIAWASLVCYGYFMQKERRAKKNAGKEAGYVRGRI